MAETIKRALQSALMTGLLIGSLAAVASSQDLSGQESPNQGDSLGDLARKTRAERPEQATTNKAQQLVEEMQQEQEATENAPPGYKDYDAGEYRVFVPFPYEIEGRDQNGTVLLGSRLGVTNTEVMAGNPVPMPGNLNDNDLHNFVMQLAQRYARAGGCGLMKIGERRAFHCSLGNSKMFGHDIFGTMTFIVGSNRVFPVMCMSPDNIDEHLVYGNKRATYQQQQAAYARQSQRFRDERTTWQICDQVVYPSIRLKEDIVVHPASIGQNKPLAEKPEAAATPAPVSSAVDASQPDSRAQGQTPSVADMARQARQAPKPKAQAVLDNAEGKSPAPAGFRAYTFQFCKGPGSLCREASIVIPEKTELLSPVNSQQVFRSTIDGRVLMLYAGPADVPSQYRSMTDADFNRIRYLATENSWSRDKPDNVSRQQLTVAGRPALATRFRFVRERNQWWIGERVLIEDSQEQFLLGCAAPEEHFADAEAVCTTLVNSLQLP